MRGDGSNVPLPDRITPTYGARQREDRGLNVGCKQIHIHDLRDPGAGDMACTGEFGVVSDDAIVAMTDADSAGCSCAMDCSPEEHFDWS